MKFKNIFYCILILCISSHAFGQTLITGRVLDSQSKKPVGGAKITIKDSSSETITNVLGFFQLTVDTSNSLLITCKGFETGLVKVPYTSSFQILLAKTSRLPIDKNIKRLMQPDMERFSAYFLPEFFNYPEPWTKDLNEKEMIRKNKVKSLMDGESEQGYNRNGDKISEKMLGKTQLFKFDSLSGRLIQIIEIREHGSTHKRTFYYSADSLYVEWTIDDKMRGAMLKVRNMEMERNYINNIFEFHVWKQETQGDVYTFTDLVLANDEWLIYNRHSLNKENLYLTSYRVGIPHVQRNYNSMGLRVFETTIENGKVIKQKQFLRDNNGLITEEIESYRNPRKKDKMETIRKKYKYEFYFD